MFLLLFIILNIFHWEFSFTSRIRRRPANGISLPEAIAVKTCTLIRSGSNGLHMKASNKVPEEAPVSGSREEHDCLFYGRWMLASIGPSWSTDACCFEVTIIMVAFERPLWCWKQIPWDLGSEAVMRACHAGKDCTHKNNLFFFWLWFGQKRKKKHL